MRPATIVNYIFIVAMLTLFTLHYLYDMPVYWYALPVVATLSLHAIGSIVLSLQYFVAVQSRGKGQAVALTFDDGPVAGKTERVLEILSQHHAKASFFCIGHRVSSNRTLAMRIFNEGHLIGNHSHWHKPTFDLQTGDAITKELAQADDAIQAAIGERVCFLRPPFGVTNPMVAAAIKRRKYTVIGWSVRSFDTVTSDPEKLFRRITRSLQGGDIILLHDHCESTITILPALLQHVAKLGLKVVRVDELLNENAYRAS